MVVSFVMVTNIDTECVFFYNYVFISPPRCCRTLTSVGCVCVSMIQQVILTVGRRRSNPSAIQDG
jgi:hypothetical protein